MDDIRLQDTVRRGLGRAARVAGAWCDAYRPDGPHEPLAAERRFLKLNAAFSAASGFRQPVGYGQATCHGIFDAAYTEPGDYLVERENTMIRRGTVGGIWFVVAQQPLAPVLCVRTNRIASFSRPGAPNAAGVNAYGGVTAGTAAPLAEGWPVSVLSAGGSGLDTAGLPADAQPGAWSVLLPAIEGVVFRAGDLMADDLDRRAVIAAAELTELGWRLLARQATT